MPYTKTVWTDRIVQNPLTYNFSNNPDGSTTLIPAEGTITQAGTALTAAALNNLETQYDQAKNDINAYINFGMIGATGTTGQTITAGADTKMVLNPMTEISTFLDGTIANNEFTVPTAGVYKVEANLMFTVAASASIEGKLFKNGTVAQFLYKNQNGVASAQLMGAGSVGYYKLVAGDKLSIYGYCSATGSSFYGGFCRIYFSRVGT